MSEPERQSSWLTSRNLVWLLSTLGTIAMSLACFVLCMAIAEYSYRMGMKVLPRPEALAVAVSSHLWWVALSSGIVCPYLSRRRGWDLLTVSLVQFLAFRHSLLSTRLLLTLAVCLLANVS